MSAGISMSLAGGKGSLNPPYYKNGGKWKVTGLRNKRRSYWAKIHMKEAKEKQRKAEALELLELELESRYSYRGNYDDYRDVSN